MERMWEWVPPSRSKKSQQKVKKEIGQVHRKEENQNHSKETLCLNLAKVKISKKRIMLVPEKITFNDLEFKVSLLAQYT